MKNLMNSKNVVLVDNYNEEMDFHLKAGMVVINGETVVTDIIDNEPRGFKRTDSGIWKQFYNNDNLDVEEIKASINEFRLMEAIRELEDSGEDFVRSSVSFTLAGDEDLIFESTGFDGVFKYREREYYYTSVNGIGDVRCVRPDDENVDSCDDYRWLSREELLRFLNDGYRLISDGFQI